VDLEYVVVNVLWSPNVQSIVETNAETLVNVAAKRAKDHLQVLLQRLSQLRILGHELIMSALG